MKNLSIFRLFTILLVLCLVLSCAKDEDWFNQDPSEVEQVLKSDQTKYIPESDITDQLINDLSNGQSVKLPSGHFYLSESIFIQGYPGGAVKGHWKG